MNQIQENQSPDPELSRRIAELQPPLPDPAYVERSRKMFTGGVHLDTVDERFGGRSSVGSWLWAGGGLAAAAALVLAFVLGSPAPSWQIADATIQGSVFADGEEVDASTLAQSPLASGTRIRAGTDELTLVVRDALALVLAPSAEVTVGSRAGLTGPTLTAVVHQGTTWGTTGPAFPRKGFRIETDHALVHVTGTVFSVLCSPESTCVCVLRGAVEARVKSTGESVVVPPEQALSMSTGDVSVRFMNLTPPQIRRLESMSGVETSLP